MRKLNKLISIVLIASLLLSLTCVSSFAKSKNTPLNYVYMGDSMTYNFANDRHMYTGTFKESYPVIVGNEFGYQIPQHNNINRMKDYTFVFGGGRALDYYALLNPDYNADEFIKMNYSDFNNYRNSAADLVANADVISIQLGLGDLAYFLRTNIFNIISGEKIYSTDLKQLFTDKEIKKYLPAAKKAVDNMLCSIDDSTVDDWQRFLDKNLTAGDEKKLKSALGGEVWDAVRNLGTKIDAVTDSVVYAYMSATIMIDKLVKQIRSMNKDVKIYLMGIYNPLGDIELTYKIGSHKHSLHPFKAVDPLIAGVNTHTLGLAARTRNCYYVPAPKDVEVFGETLGYDDEFTTDMLTAFINGDKNIGYTHEATKDLVKKAYLPGARKLFRLWSIDLNKLIKSGITHISKYKTLFSVENYYQGSKTYTRVFGSFFELDTFGNLKANYADRVMMTIYMASRLDGLFVHPDQKGHNAVAANLIKSMKKYNRF